MSSSRVVLGEFHPGRLSKDNPLQNPNYLHNMDLLPAMGTAISSRVAQLTDFSYQPLSFDMINNNAGIIGNDELEKQKQTLRGELKELIELLDTNQVIQLFIDDCFTNDYLKETLQAILGPDLYKQAVVIYPLDFTKKASENTYKIHQNSIHIIGGSLADTYQIDPSWYHSPLAEHIRETANDFHGGFRNNRILGVCFGQQFIANTLGMSNPTPNAVIVTHKGKAQFGLSNQSMMDFKFLPKVFMEAFSGITNNGRNMKFSSIFTRTGYVTFDLLGTGKSSSLIVPIYVDDMTKTISGWGTRNGDILAIQNHPELGVHDDRYDMKLKYYMGDLIPHLVDYKNIGYLYQNFSFDDGFFQKHIKNDIGETFYTDSLLAFVRSIRQRHLPQKEMQESIARREPIESAEYKAALHALLSEIRGKVDDILQLSSPDFSNKNERIHYLSSIDEIGRLKLLTQLDWKVNRGVEEISSVLGIQDIGNLISEHQKALLQSDSEKKVYFMRDWGAGDGSLIRQLYERLKQRDIIFYGVGDYIYFDIYPSMKKIGSEMGIPEEVLILYFETFVQKFDQLAGEHPTLSVIQIVEKMGGYIPLDPERKIHHSSITSSQTMMYSQEGGFYLTSEQKDFIRKNEVVLSQFTNVIENNFYDLFSGFFERIFISKFSDFDMKKKALAQVDFQVSIRATSHIDGEEYKRVLLDYCDQYGQDGSIYLDNGVHRSYTGVPRLPEICEIFVRHQHKYDFKLIYDTNTNYFTSLVIIEQLSHRYNKGWDDIEKNLSPGHILVDVNEANHSTFFRLEYFVRMFITKNFKNYDVFYDCNPLIIEALRQMVRCIQQGVLEPIPEIILDLVNGIAKSYKSDTIVYDEISLDTLVQYGIDGVYLKDILQYPIFTPPWMNIDGERKY